MALTGFLNNGVCYSSLSAAMDAHYSSARPSSDGSFFTFDALSGWSVQSPNVVGLIPAPSNIFPSCDPSAAFLDGLTVAYLVLGVMVISIIWKNLQRAAT